MKIGITMKHFILGSGLGGALLASPALATSHIEIRNLTTHRACFATTTSYYLQNEGTGSVTQGWECVASGGSFSFDDEDYTYVSAVDETNADFLQSRLNNYPSIDTYAPSDAVETFGVDKMATTDGTFKYSYYVNDDDWADDAVVPDRGALTAALAQHGFKKITGRVFRAADYPGGLVVLINF